MPVGLEHPVKTKAPITVLNGWVIVGQVAVQVHMIAVFKAHLQYVMIELNGTS